MRICSKQAYSTLKLLWDDVKSILDLDAQSQASFVRGFFDAEGSVPNRKPGTGFRISIYQKDVSKLHIIRVILKRFGVEVGKLYKSRDVGQLTVRKKQNIILFREMVGYEHSDKIQAFKALLS